MNVAPPLLGVVVLVATACGSRASKYPAPIYEEPVLPKWEPSEPEEDDPFANLDEMEGEWVTDDDGESDEDSTPAEPPETGSEEVEGTEDRATEEPPEAGSSEVDGDSEAENREKQPEEPIDPAHPAPESPEK